MASSTGDIYVIKEGWLQKRGEFIKNWRPRFFVIRSDGTFTGYKQGPIGGVYPEPLNYFKIEGINVIPRDNIKKYAFMVRCLQMTTFVERVFCADSNEDRESWMSSIKTVSEDLQLQAASQSKHRHGRSPSPGRDRSHSSGSLDEHLSSGGQSTPHHHDDHRLKPSSPVPAPRKSKQKEKPKEKTIDDFEMMKVLGKGTFGKVVLCKEKETGSLFAMKILKKDYIQERDEVDHTMTERKVMKTMKHPFLTSLQYSFQTESRLCFVMEYVSGGELFYHLTKTRGFGEERSRFYSAEITLAIGFLHQHNIVYRDLKLENLLLDSEGHIKLTDFGLCKEDIGSGSTTSTFCGTPEYLAPEVLLDNDYGREVDWWGLGVVLFEMVCGKLPFFHKHQDDLFDAILHADVRFPKNMSDNCRAILAGFLQKDPKRRLGWGETDVEEVKSQPFFQYLNWHDLYDKKIKPPFVPTLMGDDDVSNFDPEFTLQPARLTPPGEEELDFEGI